MKSCIRNIKANCKRERSILFKIFYVCKMEVFCNTKDKTPKMIQSFIVYEFVCSGCNSNHVGKTGKTLYDRSVEHA